MNEKQDPAVDEILQHHHEALRTVCAPVTEFTGMPDLVERMRKAMFAGEVLGVGLAANQIGVLQRVIIIHCPTHSLAMVNPIIKRDSGQQRVNDGCLSVQHGRLRKPTCRASEIFVRWQDTDGAVFARKFKGLVAAIIQHEVDHLDGKLFIDLLMSAA